MPKALLTSLLISGLLLTGCSNESTSEPVADKSAEIKQAKSDACAQLGRISSLALGGDAADAFNKLADLDNSYTEIAITAYEAHGLGVNIKWVRLDDIQDYQRTEFWKTLARLEQFCAAADR